MECRTRLAGVNGHVRISNGTFANAPIGARKVPNMQTNLENLDQLLTREQAAQALTRAGFPTKAKTLATKATRGGGPPYRLYSARALYRWGDALEWARLRLTPVIRSTSELSARRDEA
jgi:hypothetical protein